MIKEIPISVKQAIILRRLLERATKCKVIADPDKLDVTFLKRKLDTLLNAVTYGACQVCGNSFIQSHKPQMHKTYCGQRCRQIAYHRRKNFKMIPDCQEM